jgi:hypothetical protein
MKIDSTKVVVAANHEVVASFLKDSNNLIHMLPKEQIADWRSTAEECSFKVQGGVTISLIQDGSEGMEKIFMKSGEKSPFPFKLTIFNNLSGLTSNGHIEFDGEVNKFLKMMLEKPLTSLFNQMAEKLQEHFQ